MTEGPDEDTLDQIDRNVIAKLGGEDHFLVLAGDDRLGGGKFTRDDLSFVDLGNVAIAKVHLIAAGKYDWTCEAERQRDLQRLTDLLIELLRGGRGRPSWGFIKGVAETIEHLYGHLTVPLPYTPGGTDYPEVW